MLELHCIVSAHLDELEPFLMHERAVIEQMFIHRHAAAKRGMSSEEIIECHIENHVTVSTFKSIVSVGSVVVLLVGPVEPFLTQLVKSPFLGLYILVLYANYLVKFEGSAIDVVEELICIVDGISIGYEHLVVRNLIVVHESIANGLDGIESVTLILYPVGGDNSCCRIRPQEDILVYVPHFDVGLVTALVASHPAGIEIHHVLYDS